jgi:hypothetical protein
MEKEEQPFFYGILRILDCGFQVEEAIEADIDAMKVGYGMNFLFDVDNNWIDFLIRADFRDEKTGITFVTGTAKTIFSIKDFKNLVDENDKIQFPKGSLETLFGIAFGHLRALLAKNLGGTKYSHVYVPVINAHVVFNDLLHINIEKFKQAQAEGKIEVTKKEDSKQMEDIALAPNTEAKKIAKKREVGNPNVKPKAKGLGLL